MKWNKKNTQTATWHFLGVSFITCTIAKSKHGQCNLCVLKFYERQSKDKKIKRNSGNLQICISL